MQQQSPREMLEALIHEARPGWSDDGPHHARLKLKELAATAADMGLFVQSVADGFTFTLPANGDRPDITVTVQVDLTGTYRARRTDGQTVAFDAVEPEHKGGPRPFHRVVHSEDGLLQRALVGALRGELARLKI